MMLYIFIMINSLLSPTRTLKDKRSSKYQKLVVLCVCLITFAVLINSVFATLTYIVLYDTIKGLNAISINMSDISSIIRKTDHIEYCIEKFIGPVCSLDFLYNRY